MFDFFDEEDDYFGKGPLSEEKKAQLKEKKKLRKQAQREHMAELERTNPEAYEAEKKLIAERKRANKAARNSAPGGIPLTYDPKTKKFILDTTAAGGNHSKQQGHGDSRPRKAQKPPVPSSVPHSQRQLLDYIISKIMVDESGCNCNIHLDFHAYKGLPTTDGGWANANTYVDELLAHECGKVCKDALVADGDWSVSAGHTMHWAKRFTLCKSTCKGSFTDASGVPIADKMAKVSFMVTAQVVLHTHIEEGKNHAHVMVSFKQASV